MPGSRRAAEARTHGRLAPRPWAERNSRKNKTQKSRARAAKQAVQAAGLGATHDRFAPVNKRRENARAQLERLSAGELTAEDTAAPQDAAAPAPAEAQVAATPAAAEPEPAAPPAASESAAADAAAATNEQQQGDEEAGRVSPNPDAEADSDDECVDLAESDDEAAGLADTRQHHHRDCTLQPLVRHEPAGQPRRRKASPPPRNTRPGPAVTRHGNGPGGRVDTLGGPHQRRTVLGPHLPRPG